MSEKRLHSILKILLYLLAAAFSIRQMIEPDLWWQIAAGNWIIDHHAVPYADPFSFTFLGTPWVNIKWGFEWLMAWFMRLSGPQNIPLIQTAVSGTILYFLIKTTSLFTENKQSISFTVSMGLGLLVFLMASEYRMNSRPEMFSHLLTAIAVFLITADFKHASRRIYFIIPLQLLWANMHDGYGTGLILIILYNAYLWFRKWHHADKPLPVHQGLTLLGALVATCMNPYGFKLLLKPLSTFQQIADTKYTTEFLNYTDYHFWSFGVYLSAIAGILSMFFLLFSIISATLKSKKTFLKSVTENENTFSILLLLAFMLLAMTAYRNVIFFTIILTPYLIAVLTHFTAKLKGEVTTRLSYLLMFVILAVYGLTVSNRYYQLTSSRNKFGLEIPAIGNPLSTGSFLASQHVKGNIFSDYLSSSYLLYRLYPDFKTYIDLRDHEIFTPDFFERYAELLQKPDLFLKADSTYDFKWVVLTIRENDKLHEFLYHHPLFHLVHLDEVCAIYLKTTDAINTVDYAEAPKIYTSVFSQSVNHILNPFYDTGNPNHRLLLAGYFLKVGEDKKALSFIGSNKLSDDKNGTVADILGQYYINRFRKDTTAMAALYLDSAQTCFKLALAKNNKLPQSYYGMGLTYYSKKLFKPAVAAFENGLQYEPDNLNAHLYLADCYERLAAFGNADKNYRLEIEHLLAANRLNPNNPFITTDLGFIYYKLNNCDEAVYYLKKIENFDGLSEEDRQLAKQYIFSCR